MIQKPDIVAVLLAEGIQLKLRGKSLWALCPLHKERTPSFKVDRERQTFYCFGCHTRGDAIDFVCAYKSLSFKESLAYLGISGKPRRIDQNELRKRALVKDFNRWCAQYYDAVCSLYRTLQRAKMQMACIEEVEALSDFYHKESLWVHHLEILQDGSEEDKFALYEGLLYAKAL